MMMFLRKNLVCLFLFSIFLPVGTLAEEIKILQNQRVIQVQGEGEVEVTPDSFQFEFTVETDGFSLKSAQKDSAQKVSEVLNALKALNIPNIEFSTEGFDFGTEKNYGSILPGKKSVRNTVKVKAEKLQYENLGHHAASCIDEAMIKGASQVTELDFYLKDQEGAVREALQKAVENAQDRASLIAQKLGVSIKEPNYISSSISYPRYPTYELQKGKSSFLAERATPLSPGKQTIVVSVQAEFKF